jgi:hypothetical protein
VYDRKWVRYMNKVYVELDIAASVIVQVIIDRYRRATPMCQAPK